MIDVDPNGICERATVLIVDDSADNLALISTLLKGRYHVKIANTGDKAIRYAHRSPRPDLILLDVVMPGLSGYDVIRELKANSMTQDIPVIFLTSMRSDEDEQSGLELGASDYISKPISPPILLARIKTQLENKSAADFLRDHNVYLETEVARRTREVAAIQDVTTLALTSLAETRDSDTGNHIRRTQHYVKTLAQTLQRKSKYVDFLSDRTIDVLFKTAPLHDIGKVGIPDRILLKPGRLTPEEFEIMKTHTTLGRDALEAAEMQFGKEVEFLRYAKEIAYSHQEKWDGTGYPQGLSGGDIPISGRLMAVADVYDALISRRVYKEPMSHSAAVSIMCQGRGAHFDPDILDAFLELEDVFQEIACRYVDTDEDLINKAAQLEQLKGPVNHVDCVVGAA